MAEKGNTRTSLKVRCHNIAMLLMMLHIPKKKANMHKRTYVYVSTANVLLHAESLSSWR